jgi:hypothetical protein
VTLDPIMAYGDFHGGPPPSERGFPGALRSMADTTWILLLQWIYADPT